MTKQGFSLIEILIGIALMGVLMVTVNVMLFSALRSSRKAAAVGAVNSEVASAVDSMVQIIKFARSVSCNAGNTALTVTRLNDDILTYSLTSQQLASTSGSNTSLLTSNELAIVNNCSGGVFSCVGSPPRVVNICFDARVVGGTDVTDRAGSGVGDVRFETEVTLRNFGN